MERDTRLDSLRGLLLLYISAGHLLMSTFSAYGRVLDALTFPLGYFPVLTAFIFVSGLVAGRASAAVLANAHWSVIAKATGVRMLTIYLAQLLILLVVVAGVQYFPQLVMHSRLAYLEQLPWIALVKGASLLVQPNFVDILPIYIFSSLLVFPALLMLRNRLGWLVVTFGFGLWAYAQSEPQLVLQQCLYRHFYIDLGRFEFLAWQFIFMLAFVLGYYAQRGVLQALKVSPLVRRLGLAIAAGLVGFLLLIRRDLLVVDGFSPDEWLNWRSLSWFSLVNFLLVAYVVYRTAEKWPAWFQWRGLALLGRHSLWVFTYQSLALFGLLIFKGKVLTLPPGWQATVFFAFLASLYLPALYRESRLRKQNTAESKIPFTVN